MRLRTLAAGLLLAGGAAAVAARAQEKPTEAPKSNTGDFQTVGRTIPASGVRPTFVRCGERFVNASLIAYTEPRRSGDKPVVWVYFAGDLQRPLSLVGGEAEAFNKAMARLAE